MKKGTVLSALLFSRVARRFSDGSLCIGRAQSQAAPAAHDIHPPTAYTRPGPLGSIHPTLSDRRSPSRRGLPTPGRSSAEGPVECHDEHRRSCNGSLQEDAAEACGVSLGRKAVEDDELELERRGRAPRIDDSPIYDVQCLERRRSVSKVDLRTAQEVVARVGHAGPVPCHAGPVPYGDVTWQRRVFMGV